LANKRSALKAHRQSEKRRLRNRSVRSEVRTYVKKARLGIAAGSSEEASPAVVDAVRELDKAANKNVIHRNQAARRKSRLMKQLAALAAPKSETTEAAPTTTRRRATGTATRSTTTRARTTRSK